MNIKGRVSVVIPIYNCERYIEKCIESVLKQNVDFEIILIDDCTMDNSYEVIKKYLQYENIKYFKQEKNMGVAMARNRGVKEATGEYIAFLDSDDWWADEKLKKQLKIFEENEDCAFTYTARELFYENGESSGRIINTISDINYKKMLCNNYVPCSSVVIKRAVALKYPMVKDIYHEDYINWLCILRDGFCAKGINEPLLKYRLTVDGKSRNKIKSFKMTYGVYKFIGLNLFERIFYITLYSINGILKYL